MTQQELSELVRAGESDRVEFKKTTGQLAEGVHTACAMLNGVGGFVLFGVTAGGRADGQDVSTKTLEDVHNELRKIEPAAFPDVERVELPSGRSVIVLRVPGGGGPYTHDGRAYLRNGPTTVVMPQSIYERKLLERAHAANRWENLPAEGVTVADLHAEEVIRTVDEAVRRGRMDDPGTRDIRALLTGMKLLDGGRLLNAAVVLFGKASRVLPNYPQCLLKVARFRGVDKTEFLDNRQEYGHAFDLLIRAQRFLRDHLPIAGRVVPGIFERQDDPLYPPEALREAVANALCHRDYAAGGGSVRVASTGPLPFGQTPADLMRPHPSRPWNPLVANVFHRRGVIESWGRGVQKMSELTRKAGLVAPEIETGVGEVIVRFRPTRYVAPSRIGLDLSLLQQQILQTLAAYGPCPLSRVLAVLPPGTNRRTVQDNLRMLVQFGLVDAPTKRGLGAVWRLKGEPE
jgi:ATP-dependent DNA helicase RecG